MRKTSVDETFDKNGDLQRESRWMYNSPNMRAQGVTPPSLISNNYYSLHQINVPTHIYNVPDLQWFFFLRAV
jgi:hypothetical protein